MSADDSPRFRRFAEWTDAPCPCGRTYPRFPLGIIGRIDDMIVIRGENVYPSAIEEVLRGFPELGGGEFEIVVTRARHMDELTIRTEAEAQVDPAALEQRIVDESNAKPDCGRRSSCARSAR